MSFPLTESEEDMDTQGQDSYRGLVAPAVITARLCKYFFLNFQIDTLSSSLYKQRMSGRMSLLVNRCFQLNCNQKTCGNQLHFLMKSGTPVRIFRGLPLEFDPGFQYFRPGYRSIADFETRFGNFSRGLNIWRRVWKIWNQGMKN